MATLEFSTGARQGEIVEVPLGESTILGRSSSANITCNDKRLSRHHCIIESGMLGYLVTDLESSNGTWVNGQRISEASLKDGDEISIGGTNIIFSDDADYAAAETHIQITEKRSKLAMARMASMGQQDGFISAKSHFCETCGGHITEEERESGASEKIENVWVCPDCVEELGRLKEDGAVSSVRSYMGFRRKRQLSDRVQVKQEEGETSPEPGTDLK